MERYSGLICFAPQQLLSFTVKAIVEERRKNGGDSNKKGDFLDVLLPVTNLSEDEKVSFVLDALLGGYETTSLLMSMAVYFLGLSPSALQQLKLEHQSIRVHKKKNEGLSIEGYKKMEFTQFVINEALRCGNIVKFVHRKVLKDVTFKEMGENDSSMVIVILLAAVVVWLLPMLTGMLFCILTELKMDQPFWL